MEIGAFYTEGSNRIKVELYAEPSNVTINLLNSNVSDSKISIIDPSPKQLSKFIDRAITVEPHHFIDNHATIYFNFLDYDIESYMIEAICGEESKLCNINVIEADVVPNTEPYLEDHVSDIQNVEPTTIEGEMFNEIPGEPIVDIDFTSDKIVLEGNAEVDYRGGGNRYLVNDEGILVNQVQSCKSINDRYSPFQLNTTIKCEDSVTNLFTKFTFDSSVITENKTQVQTGLFAYRYSVAQKNTLELKCTAKVNGTTCFSVLMASDRKTKCKLAINSLEKEVEVTPEYSMFYVTNSCVDESSFKIISTDYSAKLFVLLPQIELGNYPTSRVISGKTREKDLIVVSCDECNVVFNPEGSDKDIIGGFVNVKFISGREFSNENAIIDWRNSNDEGLLIYQETNGSIIATFGESHIARSLPITMEEGKEVEVKVQWDMDNLAIQVNEDEPVIVACPEIPMPEEYPSEIKVGWSRNLNALNGDIVSLQIGQ